MASIDKTSIRNEIARLKADFDALCAEGRVANDIKVLMHSMLLIMELMLTIFLEKKTKKTATIPVFPPLRLTRMNRR